MENPGHRAVSVTIYGQCELWQGPGLSMPQFPYREVNTQYLYQLRDMRHSLEVIMWHRIQNKCVPCAHSRQATFTILSPHQHLL